MYQRPTAGLLGSLLAIAALTGCATTAHPADGAERTITQWEAAESGALDEFSFDEMVEALAEAEREFEARLETDPDDVDALIMSARAGRIRQQLTAVDWSGQEELPDPALEAAPLIAKLNRAIELAPDRADALYWRARVYGTRSPVIREGALL